MESTQRRQVVARMQPWLSAEHFQLAVQLVPDYAMFLLDATGIVRTWNLGAERVKGYRAEEIVGQHFACLYTDEDVRGCKPATALRIAEQLGRYEQEGWRARRDGSRFWAGVTLTALHDERRTLIGFAKVTCDLGARRVAPEVDDVDGPSRSLEALLEHASEPLVLTDSCGIAFAATPAAEQLVGVHRSFFRRRALINVIARQDTSRFRALIADLERASPGETRAGKLRMRHRGGGVFIADIQVRRAESLGRPTLLWTLRREG